MAFVKRLTTNYLSIRRFLGYDGGVEFERGNALSKWWHKSAVRQPGKRRPANARRRAAWLALPLVATVGFAIGENDRSAIAEILADPMSILGQRSPGERPAGALTQSKPRYAKLASARKPFAPSERVLSQERERPAADAPTFAVPEGMGAGDPGDAARDFSFGDPIPEAPPPGGFVPNRGQGGGGDGIPGGPGTDGPPITNPPVTPPVNPTPPGPDKPPIIIDPGTPPTSAVPEPATWIALIFGFFATAGAMRWSRTRQAAAIQVRVHSKTN